VFYQFRAIARALVMAAVVVTGAAAPGYLPPVAAQTFSPDLTEPDAWRAMNFDEGLPPTRFEPMPQEGGGALRVITEGTTSAIVTPEPVNPHNLPYLRWEWKLVDPLEGADLRSLFREDTAIRVAALFREELEDLPALMRVWARRRREELGELPPTRALNYVWTTDEYEGGPIRSLWSSRIQFYVVNHGTDRLGERVTHQVNIVEDYRRAMGADPPDEVFLAIMADSDNTEGRAEAIVYELTLSANP
jgi:hypothetical protein